MNFIHIQFALLQMINCNFKFTISLYKDPIHLVLIQYLYKDQIYIKNMSTCIFIIISCDIKFFIDRYINILPLTTRKIGNDMVLLIMSIGHFLIIWESNTHGYVVTTSFMTYVKFLQETN